MAPLLPDANNNTPCRSRRRQHTTSPTLRNNNNSSKSLAKSSHSPPPLQQHSSLSHRPTTTILRKTSSTISEASVHISLGSLFSLALVQFSVYFPFFLAPLAASKTYHPAFFQYNDDKDNESGVHQFDTTFWTYGTDYFLAVCMAALIYSISTSKSGVMSTTIAWRSRGLLACYMMSVLAGGIAHQFYTTVEMRNTLSFRVLWTICVGTVTAASAFMGPIASELVLHCQEGKLPFVPEWFWWGYGACATVFCAWGGLSFQRPACDIFIAGITQFPPTFYLMAILMMGLPTSSISLWTRRIGVVGFILNAPLLPMYPLLVQYTDWSLAGINTLLHMWLLAAWGLQGITLRKIEQALARDSVPPPQAVPMKMKKKGM